MIPQELQWKSKDGLDIFGLLWKPTTLPKYVLCLVHGLGEHCARYQHVADFLVEQDIAVIAYDQRGHGKSGGQRGHFDSFDNFLDDVDLLIQQASTHFPNIPQLIYGHSMGGNVVGNYLIQRNQNFKGAILSSPYIRLSFTPPALKVTLGKLMRNILPTLSLPSGLDATAIARDKEVVANYKKDKLVHDKVSARLGIELMDTGEHILHEATKIKIPILIYHGSADRLTSHDASKELATKIGANAKFISYDGLYHETHNEPEKDIVFANLKSWIEAL